MLRAHGDPMDLAALRADLPNLDRARLDDARDHLRHMKELQSQSPGDAPEMTVGPTKFRVFLVDFTNYLSKIVGAYGIPMTYLTVPAVIDPANADHVKWAQVPLVEATYSRDNRHFWTSQFTKGIFVYSTLYDQLVVGPTALDQESRTDDAVDPDVRADLVDHASRVMGGRFDPSRLVGEYSGYAPDRRAG
ncbi:hypothetical protein THAOC_11707, partial [Thalassiosira oceanica]